MKAGFVAAIPLVAANVVVAFAMTGVGPFSQVILDAAVTLVVCTILGFIISGLKKALFFVPISSPNLALVMGLAVAGMLMYNDKSEVLIGHSVKQASVEYLGATLAAIIPALAAGLLWGMLMGGIYSKTVEQQARSRPTATGRLSQMLGLSRTQPAPVIQPATVTVTTTKDRCAGCGKKVRGRLRSKVKIMECKRENVVYCEECYTKFPRFGGITYTCPRCRGALAPVK
jgi:hypothetical protein